jgi:hypothetical protein
MLRDAERAGATLDEFLGMRMEQLTRAVARNPRSQKNDKAERALKPPQDIAKCHERMHFYRLKLHCVIIAQRDRS